MLTFWFVALKHTNKCAIVCVFLPTTTRYDNHKHLTLISVIQTIYCCVYVSHILKQQRRQQIITDRMTQLKEVYLAEGGKPSNNVYGWVMS